MIYQLEAMHDARKSFYGKALVESGGGTLTLYSYGAKVAETQGQGRIALYPDADYSPESDDIPWSMVPELVSSIGCSLPAVMGKPCFSVIAVPIRLTAHRGRWQRARSSAIPAAMPIVGSWGYPAERIVMWNIGQVAIIRDRSRILRRYLPR